MIEVDGVRKAFGGQPALDGLDFSVPEGGVLGLVGPLGAGKSTAVRILSTLVRLDAGRATIGGVGVDDAAAVRRLVGYLPDRAGVYPRMTATDYLVFYAGVHGVAPRRRRALAHQLLEALDLADLADEAASDLAAGRRRRLALARTLVHDPAVLLLDDPVAGLDPVSQHEVMTLLTDLAGMGKTMVVTARALADLESVCTSVSVLRGGRVVANGSPDQIRNLVPDAVALAGLGHAE